jgi:hypothetical protein
MVMWEQVIVEQLDTYIFWWYCAYFTGRFSTLISTLFPSSIYLNDHFIFRAIIASEQTPVKEMCLNSL